MDALPVLDMVQTDVTVLRQLRAQTARQNWLQPNHILDLECRTWHVCCRDCAEKVEDGRQTTVTTLATQSDGVSLFGCRPCLA